MDTRLISVLKIIEHSKIFPDKLALVDNNVRITYECLARSIQKIASRINRICRSSNKPRVVVLSDGTANMVLNILAAQYAGAAYVPLEHKIPEKRITAIFEDSSPCLILGEMKNEALCRSFSEQFSVPYGITDSSNLGKAGNETDIKLYEKPDEQILMALNETDSREVELQLTEDMSAVVFFTSGSTGRPKGVELSHLGYSRWFEGIMELTGSVEHDRIALTTNHSFDLSLGELILGLMGGATLYVANQITVRDPVSFIEWLDKHQITIFQSVPSLLKQILQFHTDSPSLKKLRLLLTCGEPLEVELVRKFKKTFATSPARLLNLYGPVEASIQVSYCWSYEYLHRSEKVVPLGKPLKYANIRLLPVEDGNMELYLSGDHLARGYLDQKKTAEAFIVDENRFESSERFYKTGDLGQYNELGDITYVGRVDHQVKINGYRIEASEISSVIINETDASDAAVLFNSKNDAGELVAFVVSDNESALELRRAIAKYLPVYMIPRKIIFIPEMPLTTNGKLDQVKLKKDYL